MRHGGNTAVVLIVTAATAFVMWAFVTAANLGAPTESYQTVATANGTEMVCPMSGCAATTCHGVTGAPAPSGGAAQSGSSSAGANGSAQVMTCPRTGCTASTCHGATGAPPPEGSGYGQYGQGRGNRYGYARPEQDAPVYE
jgi:hypothetical protein